VKSEEGELKNIKRKQSNEGKVKTREVTDVATVGITES